jgi:predicted Zn-dependent protease
MKSDPTDPEVLYASYRVHSEMASAALAKLSAHDPNSAWVHEVLGQNLMAQEQYSGAAEEFRKAIAAAPTLGGLHYQLGQALLQEARNEENRSAAEKEFSSELRIDQRDAGSLLKLGQIEIERRNYEQASVLVKRALSIRPRYAEGHATLAKILEQRGDPATAIMELEIAERLAPDTKTTHYQLAQLYRAQGRTADADREVALFKRITSGEARPMP